MHSCAHHVYDLQHPCHALLPASVSVYTQASGRWVPRKCRTHNQHVAVPGNPYNRKGMTGVECTHSESAQPGKVCLLPETACRFNQQPLPTFFLQSSPPRVKRL